MTPRPPEYYSDSDYSDYDEDGLMFSCDYDENGSRIKKSYAAPALSKEEEIARDLYRNVFVGDVDGFRNIWSSMYPKIDINEPLQSFDWTPLMFACQSRHTEMVHYLLFELKANPNANSNDMTSLILACCGSMDIYADSDEISSREEAKVLEICQWLIECGVTIDKSNVKRETALMYASSNGFVSVVLLLLKNQATLDACDNEGKTALLYAVNGNRFEVTKTLIEAGAMIDVTDQFDNTPKKLAQDNGFDDIYALFPPDPIIDVVPGKFLHYNTYEDLIPSAFPERNIPLYSPDIYTMLYGMRAAAVDYKLFESQMDLPEFLVVTNDRLQQIGVDFPYHRKRILFGLMQFHQKSWSKSSLTMPKMDANMQQYFDVLSNCLKQLIVMEASVKFIESHEIFATHTLTDESIGMRREMNQKLHFIRKNVLKLTQIFGKIDAMAPPPPLFICRNVIDDVVKKTNTFRSNLYRRAKFLICFGMGFVVLDLIKPHFY